jgi:polar amino acid transport system substrate-binding protein
VWKNQFQFAGYLMAKEKGFYKQEGLEVEILEKDSRIDNVEEVVSGDADFAVGRSSILVSNARGADIVALMAAFQHSPMILLTLGDSGLSTPGDLRGKRIMLSPNGKRASEIVAMLIKSGLREQDYIYTEHSFNVEDLVDGHTDAIVAYSSNEPYQLKLRNIKHHIIHPKDYGFDMYADILFTSRQMIKQSPDLVNRFYRASLRGWLYAFENIPEAASIIYQKYNTQGRTKQALEYEGTVLKEHAYDEYGGFGTITIPRLREMAQVYLLADILNKGMELRDFIYHPPLSQLYLSSKELEYIGNKSRIKLCVKKDWMPYEGYMAEKHAGIVADYMKLLQDKIGIPFLPIATDSINQAREFLQSGKCEAISNVIPTVWGGRFHSYSIPYLNIPVSIATRSDGEEKSELPESIAVIKESAFEEIVRVRHPEIKVVPVTSGMQGLDLIKDGSVKGMLCTGAHISNMISEHNIKDIDVEDFAKEEIGVTVAVVKGNELLLGLLDKAIRSITNEERHDISNGWINVKPRPTVDPDLIWKMLIGFGLVIMLAVYVNWMVISHNKKLIKIAGTDWLTQLPNRHNVIRKMEGFINHSNRYCRTVSVIYFDIDNFKAINDRFGHYAGDKVLKKLANLILSETRVTDICGRWGGEEFILASLEADVDESAKIAEKLRKKIEFHDFGMQVKVTCSFGVAQYESEEPLEHFIHRADLALYEAKSMGRNRVMVYESG